MAKVFEIWGSLVASGSWAVMKLPRLFCESRKLFAGEITWIVPLSEQLGRRPVAVKEINWDVKQRMDSFYCQQNTLFGIKHGDVLASLGLVLIHRQAKCWLRE